MSADFQKQQLLHAKGLIQQRQFEEARIVLQSLPDHPTAQKWLEKLDSIAPVPKVVPQVNLAAPKRVTNSQPSLKPITATDENPFDVASLPLVEKPPKLPHGEPFNPNNFNLFIFFFMPLAALAVADNWRRLGRSQWAIPSCLINIALVFGGLGSFLVLGVVLSDSVPIYLGMFPIMFGLMGNLTFLIMAIWLQNHAYKRWAEYHDIAGMLNHNYRVPRMALIWLTITLAVSIGFSIYSYFDNRPQIYEDSTLRVTYSASWEIPPTEEQTAYCDDFKQGCFLFLRTTDYIPSQMAFTYRTVQAGYTAETQARRIWADYLEYSGAKEVTAQNGRVDGYQSLLYEFSYITAGFDEPLYGMRVMILMPTQIVQIDTWGQTKRAFEVDREAIMELILDIQVKDASNL